MTTFAPDVVTRQLPKKKRRDRTFVPRISAPWLGYTGLGVKVSRGWVIKDGISVVVWG